MPILSKEEAQALLKKVLSYSKADECEVSVNGRDGGNIRTALNAVSTAGDTSNTGLAVSSTFGKKTGTATINEFDEASLKKVVQRSEELAQLAPENPELRFWAGLGMAQGGLLEAGVEQVRWAIAAHAPWRELLEPAIALADEGLQIDWFAVENIAGAAADLNGERMTMVLPQNRDGATNRKQDAVDREIACNHGVTDVVRLDAVTPFDSGYA